MCSKLNWNALGFNTFIQSSQHAIEAFERTVLEVRRISKSIAELTETISELRFFSPSCIQEVEGDIGLLPELDDVMSTLERTRDEIMERAVGKYKEVSNLLSDIETKQKQMRLELHSHAISGHLPCVVNSQLLLNVPLLGFHGKLRNMLEVGASSSMR